MKKRLAILILVLSMVLSACYYPMYDENGNNIEEQIQKETK